MNHLEAAPCTRRALRRVDEAKTGQHEFSIVTYNILADHWIKQNTMNKEYWYSYCPNDYKIRTQGKRSHRHMLLMAELRWLDSDIVCLQEVDTLYFSEILKEELSKLDYEGLFAQKSMGIPEGVALFFKRDKFHLEETKTFHLKDLAVHCFKQTATPKMREVALLAALRHKISNNLLVVGVTHLRWGELLQTVTQVCQILIVTHALSDMVSSLETEGNQVTHILCGDFNIEPQFPAYQLLKEGRLTDKEMRTLGGVDYIRWSPDMEAPSQLLPDQVSLLNRTKAQIRNPLGNLQSAYKSILGAEPQCTNHEGPGCEFTLDYIWFDSMNLEATAALETVTPAAIEPYTGLPNEFFPSDHLSLKAYFKFVTNKKMAE
ncbi:hypothetical protein OS493_020049 [Desmophyllum pertusum]|uniref:Endonuclease/exonuclease/phosphatase domain-containing protein n=1 Tax=Desmophyllum pertusum TaxID=174260 RepID=A0A9W9YBM0_9CNID|nr:hypothetical protein OS493_020049 [Desmophyllum pertusum]